MSKVMKEREGEGRKGGGRKKQRKEYKRKEERKDSQSIPNFIYRQYLRPISPL